MTYVAEAPTDMFVMCGPDRNAGRSLERTLAREEEFGKGVLMALLDCGRDSPPPAVTLAEAGW